jgi:vacuolar-type H+-ATPase subunit I/STV1
MEQQVERRNRIGVNMDIAERLEQLKAELEDISARYKTACTELAIAPERDKKQIAEKTANVKQTKKVMDEIGSFVQTGQRLIDAGFETFQEIDRIKRVSVVSRSGAVKPVDKSKQKESK